MLHTHGDLLIVTLLCTVVFLLQALHLHEAAFSVTDEGSHAEIGRMIFEGFAPYRDFYYPHPPLLPLLIGGGLKIFGSMYPLRVIYLLLNVGGAIPLFFLLRKLTGSRFGAVAGIIMYLTFHEMMHHDSRFLGLRHLSNIFVIAFASVGIFLKKWKYRSLGETALVSLTTLLFYPAVLNIALVSLLIITREKTNRQRITLLRHYATIGSVTLVVLLLFFALVARSIDQTFLEHLGLPAMPRWNRILWIINSDPADLFLYGITTTSLLLSLAVLRGQRLLALCMLCMISLIFLPAEFWPHYTVTAVLAFAAGTALLPALFRKVLRVQTMIIPQIITVMIVAVHLHSSLPSLLGEWNGNRGGDYHQIVSELRKYPEPVLTYMEPIYAIDAEKKLVQYTYRATRFTATIHYAIPAEEHLRLAEKACTIFLPGWDRSTLPPDVLKHWRETYELMNDDPLILLTHNPHCS